MQEAGSATKNREDKYQFDNVERERERERAGGGKARHGKKKGEKRRSLCGTQHTGRSRKNREKCEWR